FFDRVRERFRLGNLRPDVHLDADDIDIAHSGGALVNGLDVIERDAELVFARTGGDVIVGARIDIGIHTQRDRRTQIFFAGDPINRLEFRFALDVEALNTLLQRIFDFLARLADSRECAFGGI